jgi:hypothetical protein
MKIHVVNATQKIPPYSSIFSAQTSSRDFPPTPRRSHERFGVATIGSWNRSNRSPSDRKEQLLLPSFLQHHETRKVLKKKNDERFLDRPVVSLVEFFAVRPLFFSFFGPHAFVSGGGMGTVRGWYYRYVVVNSSSSSSSLSYRSKLRLVVVVNSSSSSSSLSCRSKL